MKTINATKADKIMSRGRHRGIDNRNGANPVIPPGVFIQRKKGSPALTCVVSNGASPNPTVLKNRPASRSKFQPNGVPARLTKLARRTEKKLGRD